MNVFIVIPAYNEAKTIKSVLENITKYYEKNNIIVIDDGSKDNTYQVVSDFGIKIYKHFINRGLGGALGTGLQAGILNNADVIVTLDADGQHDPKEINSLIKPILDGKADVVIGSRFINNQKMPLIRKLYNWFGNFCTWLLFGIWTTDSQSGFRVFSKKAATKIEIRTNRMEVSSEIIKEIKRNQLKFVELPITAIYTEYSMSKGQNFFEGIKTIVRLIILRFRK